MQDLNDKITGNTLTAAEWNELPSEVQNVIEALGQTLTSGDLNQLGKSIAGYVANSTHYTDSGIADAYVLTKIGSKQTAPSYTDGFSTSFITSNPGTGAATVNVAGLGVKNIKLYGGADPGKNDISTRVNLVFDAPNDWFELLNPKATNAELISFDSVDSMKSDDRLRSGFSVETAAYTAGWALTIKGPVGGAKYEIVTKAEHDIIRDTSTVNEGGDHTLNNGNVAIISGDVTKVEAVQWGMTIDGDIGTLAGTDNAAVWQSIVDNMPNNGGEITLPNATIKVKTPIDYGVGLNNIKRIKTIGEYGTNGTIVFTDTAISALVRLPQDVTHTNNVAGGEFIGIDFSAKSNADYCVQGFGNHMLYRDCRFRGALLSGTDISQGWDNTYDHCYWLDNILDGESMAQGQNNQNKHIACKFVNNGRFGVFGRSSFALDYDNCLFENNGAAAFFGFGCKGLTFSCTCYFDRNGQDGHVFTTPSVTVYADIILNGSNSTTNMTVATPCTGVTIDTPFVSGNTVDPHTHVYAVSSVGLDIRNPSLNSGDISDLVTTYGSTTTSSGFSRNQGLRIGRENNFDNTYVVQNSTSAFAGQSDMLIEGALPINIGENDLNAWIQNVAGAGGVWRRSSLIHDEGLNIPVWEMDLNSTSTTDRQGFSIDSADYPDLHGKPCVFTVDVKAAASNTPTITLTANGGTRTTTSTDWFQLSLIFNMPVSGTINLDVKKGVATGIAYFASPVFAQLGANTREISKKIPSVSASFMSPSTGALVPTVGAWNRGDVVLNTTPTAGGNREAVCINSGTPGTWKSASPIDA